MFTYFASLCNNRSDFRSRTLTVSRTGALIPESVYQCNTRYQCISPATPSCYSIRFAFHRDPRTATELACVGGINLRPFHDNCARSTAAARDRIVSRSVFHRHHTENTFISSPGEAAREISRSPLQQLYPHSRFAGFSRRVSTESLHIFNSVFRARDHFGNAVGYADALTKTDFSRGADARLASLVKRCASRVTRFNFVKYRRYFQWDF